MASLVYESAASIVANTVRMHVHADGDKTSGE